jgi:hypothetical protein
VRNRPRSFPLLPRARTSRVVPPNNPHPCCRPSRPDRWCARAGKKDKTPKRNVTPSPPPALTPSPAHTRTRPGPRLAPKTALAGRSKPRARLRSSAGPVNPTSYATTPLQRRLPSHAIHAPQPLHPPCTCRVMRLSLAGSEPGRGLPASHPAQGAVRSQANTNRKPSHR